MRQSRLFAAATAAAALCAGEAMAADQLFHLPPSAADTMAFDAVTPLRDLLAPYEGKPRAELMIGCMRQYDLAAREAQRRAAALGGMASMLSPGAGGAHEAALRASAQRMRARAARQMMADRGLTAAAAEAEVAARAAPAAGRTARPSSSRDDLRRCSEFAKLLDR